MSSASLLLDTKMPVTSMSSLLESTTSQSKYNYTFGFCVDVPLPRQCSSAKPGMAAYQYNNETCNAIGSSKNESIYVVSLFDSSPT